MDGYIFQSHFIHFFFIQTPFFVLSMFLTMSKDYSEAEKRRLALQVIVAVWVVASVIFYFGHAIFGLFGITVDAFRIGAGALLFLTAIDLVQGKSTDLKPSSKNDDIAVVPLAMPITVGPAVIGTIMIKGSELDGFSQQISSYLALVLSIFLVGVLLVLSGFFERLLKKRGLNIISKMTGLILAALASQMIFEGVRNFLV